MKRLKNGAMIIRRVKVYEFLHQGTDIVAFQMIRIEGDFLDQLGFTKDAPITIHQEGNKLIILREVQEKDKEGREN